MSEQNNLYKKTLNLDNNKSKLTKIKFINYIYLTTISLYNIYLVIIF
jgi:hypothetical protein